MPNTCKTVEIARGIYWVGVEDFNRRLFDSLIPLPYGTSYNAYLVKGQDKTALIDTVEGKFVDELVCKVNAVQDLASVDYLVTNHAEPDHAGSIGDVMRKMPRARLVLTTKAVKYIRKVHHVEESRMMVVKEGDSIDLGGKTLRFIEAPWVHWPETMFTFVPEDRVLFSCDFFGTHIASDLLYDDEVGDIVLPMAKKYYAEIMMPLLPMADKALEKAKVCRPVVIAPSHGPVHRHPDRVMTAYEKWIKGPLEKKAVIIYVSMFGSTEKLAQTIRATLSAEGVNAVPHNLLVADASEIASDLVDASAIVVGVPTMLGNPHPAAASALTLLKYLRPRAKCGAIVSSYGWSGGAVNIIRSQMDGLGINCVGTLEINGPPDEAEIAQAVELGKTIAATILKTKAPA